MALGVLAGATAISLIMPMTHGTLTNPASRRMIDLAVYRTAGLSVLAGRPIYATLTRPWHLGFTYPPPAAAVLAVPLALASWRDAQPAWVLLVFLCLGVTIWYSFRPLLRRTGRWGPAVFAVIFVACAYLKPVRDEVHFGQMDMLLAALCLLDIPSWGAGLLRSHAVPHLTGEMLRSAYGIGALAIIVLLACLPICGHHGDPLRPCCGPAEVCTARDLSRE